MYNKKTNKTIEQKTVNTMEGFHIKPRGDQGIRKGKCVLATYKTPIVKYGKNPEGDRENAKIYYKGKLSVFICNILLIHDLLVQ